MGRGDLGDIERADHGGDADTHPPSQRARTSSPICGARRWPRAETTAGPPPAADCGSAAETVAQPPGDRRANNRAEQAGADEEALPPRRKSELILDRIGGAGDDDRVKAPQQPAKAEAAQMKPEREVRAMDRRPSAGRSSWRDGENQVLTKVLRVAHSLPTASRCGRMV